MTTTRAALDACVLYPASVRDTLLTAATYKLFEPVWSSESIDEMTRNLIADGRMTNKSAVTTTSAMRRHFPSAEVTSAQIPGNLAGIPSDDAHVAAAAVIAGAHYLVTTNLQHFPASTLKPFGVQVASPDEFLLLLHQRSPEMMVHVVRKQHAKLKSPPVPMEEVLRMIALTAPHFVALVRPYL